MAAGVDVAEIGAPDQLRACSNAGPFSYPVCAEFVPPAGSSTSRGAHRPHDFRGPSYRCIACTLGKPPFRDAVNKRATDRGPSAFGQKQPVIDAIKLPESGRPGLLNHRCVAIPRNRTEVSTKQEAIRLETWRKGTGTHAFDNFAG